MHTLTEEDFTQEIEPILRRIFVGNVDTEPFLSHIEERLLLYFPCGGDIERNNYWERQLAEALAHAAKIIGDTGCYLVSAWEGDIIAMNRPQKSRYAYILQSELVEALAATPGSKNRVWKKLDMFYIDFCLCSSNGNWGLLTTWDDHAFLGGSSEFMQAVRSYFPDIEKEVIEFLHDLRLEQMDGESINVKWLKQVLNHVYGSTVAEQMIIDSGLI